MNPVKKISFAVSSAFLALAVLTLSSCLNVSPTFKNTEADNTAAMPDKHVSQSVKNPSAIVSTTFSEPQNIDLLRQEIKAWYNSGGYQQAMDQVGDLAIRYLEENKNTPGKLAIVMDIDETALSNWKMEIEKNFYVDAEMIDKWQSRSDATVITPTLKLFNQAKKQNAATCFITGRKEKYRAATEENLKKAGYNGWTMLIMKPDDLKMGASEFKTNERKKLEDSGYRIIINIGDQYSDLGAYADKNFKYPDPFYFIP